MRFADFAQQLTTPETERDMVEALSELLSHLDTSELASAIYLCQGRYGEPYRRRSPQTILLDEAQIEAAIRPKEKDTESAADEPANLTDFLARLQNCRTELDGWLAGQQSLPASLVDLAASLDETSLSCLSRLLAEPLADDKAIVSALLSRAHPDCTFDNLYEPYRYTVPDLGLVARTLVEQGYWAVMDLLPQTGIPVKPQEITPYGSDVDAVWKAFGPCDVQFKFDGWQILIHKDGDKVWLFDRKLRNLTGQLPGVVAACQAHIPVQTAILDGEVVGYDPDADCILPWGETLSAPAHKVSVFDPLRLDDKDWRAESAVERRACLVKLLGDIDSSILSVARTEHAQSREHLQRLYDEAVEHPDYEGIVAIARSGKYLSARKNPSKAKLKPYVSLDTVALGYWVPRKGWPSLLVGVWDEAAVALLPVGVVEGAVIDEKNRQALLERCPRLIARKRPRSVPPDIVPQQWMIPRLVVEVTAEGREETGDLPHLGYRLRRKKEIRIRDELGIEDADDVEGFLEELGLPPGEREEHLSGLILGYKVSPGGRPSFLLGIWDEERARLLPVGGVEPELVCPKVWRPLLERCEGLQVASKPAIVAGRIAPATWIEPRIVVSVRTDGSRVADERYTPLGYTFRQKRGLQVREDLTPEQADGVERFRQFRIRET